MQIQFRHLMNRTLIKPPEGGVSLNDTGICRLVDNT